MRSAARRSSHLLALLVLSSCGGSGVAPSAPAKETSPAREAPTPPPESTATKSVEEQPACTDGSCFPCGRGFCLRGFYCDEGVPAGAACGWLPACAKDASCGCVTRALGGGHCETEGGGAHLRND